MLEETKTKNKDKPSIVKDFYGEVDKIKKRRGSFCTCYSFAIFIIVIIIILSVFIVLGLKKNWYKIYSVELTADAVDYTNLFSEKNDKVVLILWNEISWVSKKLLDLSDKKVIIPMKWKKESLNVSVAAGIVMYAI